MLGKADAGRYGRVRIEPEHDEGVWIRVCEILSFERLERAHHTGIRVRQDAVSDFQTVLVRLMLIVPGNCAVHWRGQKQDGREDQHHQRQAGEVA
jgi:hypothetical protein